MKFWFVEAEGLKKKHHNSLRVHTNTVRHRAAIGCARCHLLSVRKFQQGMVIKCLHFLVNYSIQFCYLKKWWLMWEKGCSKKKTSYCYRSDNGRTNQQIATNKWYPHFTLQ